VFGCCASHATHAMPNTCPEGGCGCVQGCTAVHTPTSPLSTCVGRGVCRSVQPCTHPPPPSHTHTHTCTHPHTHVHAHPRTHPPGCSGAARHAAGGRHTARQQPAPPPGRRRRWRARAVAQPADRCVPLLLCVRVRACVCVCFLSWRCV
jgi:hypothetical protein